MHILNRHLHHKPEPQDKDKPAITILFSTLWKVIMAHQVQQMYRYSNKKRGYDNADDEDQGDLFWSGLKESLILSHLFWTATSMLWNIPLFGYVFCTTKCTCFIGNIRHWIAYTKFVIPEMKVFVSWYFEKNYGVSEVLKFVNDSQLFHGWWLIVSR